MQTNNYIQIQIKFKYGRMYGKVGTLYSRSAKIYRSLEFSRYLPVKIRHFLGYRNPKKQVEVLKMGGRVEVLTS